MNHKRNLFIFDIDGTLADLTHRLHYIKFNASMHGFERDFKPNWDAFHEHVDKDEPIEPVIKLCETLLITNNDVWFFTGRMEHSRRKTYRWLFNNIRWFHNHDLYDHQLVMRQTGDFRPDYIIKKEMLDNMLDEDKERLVCIFDDRQQVVDMWRKNGITCLQVKDGNY